MLPSFRGHFIILGAPDPLGVRFDTGLDGRHVDMTFGNFVATRRTLSRKLRQDLSRVVNCRNVIRSVPLYVEEVTLLQEWCEG